MPRVTTPNSESESERVPSKKQKKSEIPVDDPMDEDEGDEGGGDDAEGEEEEYEIEKILDASREIFEDVSFIRWPWFQGSDLNFLRKKWRTT